MSPAGLALPKRLREGEAGVQGVDDQNVLKKILDATWAETSRLHDD